MQVLLCLQDDPPYGIFGKIEGSQSKPPTQLAIFSTAVDLQQFRIDLFDKFGLVVVVGTRDLVLNPVGVVRRTSIPFRSCIFRL